MSLKRKSNEITNLTKKNKYKDISIEEENFLNKYFKDQLDKLSELYQKNESVDLNFEKNETIKILTQPFKCCSISNFINNKSFLENLKVELLEKLEYFEKNNDLYKFQQSEDLKFVNLPYCQFITTYLKKKFLPILKKITNLDLFDNEIDITASKYEFTDVLLCHDDMFEERRIAFIIYLLDEDWCEEDGGKLDLFSKDDNNQPLEVVHSFVPKYNNLIFFEVCPYSYHQVSENLSKNKIRLSISGWFKGPKLNKNKPYLEKFILPIKYNDFFVEKEVLENYFNEIYLTDDIQNEVKFKFENESQTMLVDFLKEDKFKKIEQDLLNCEKWKLKLPANRRKYFYLNEQDYPENLKKFVSIIKSEPMFLILGNLTGLKLHILNDDQVSSSDSDSEIEPKSVFNPKCSIEIRKWDKTCYTLVHDYDPENLDKNPKLDVKFYFNHDFDCNTINGGCTYYLEKDEDDELLVVEPINNSLSLVYRDKKTVRFEKYLNYLHKKPFYEISMIFQE